MSDATTPVILSACRTPIGRYLGGLSPLLGPRLGALVIREAVSRAKISDNEVDEVIMGNVLQGGEGQAPARQAAIHAGLPGLTIPAGLGPTTGLPVGISLDGPRGSDERLLAIGIAIEHVLGRTPPPKR